MVLAGYYWVDVLVALGLMVLRDLFVICRCVEFVGYFGFGCCNACLWSVDWFDLCLQIVRFGLRLVCRFWSLFRGVWWG